MSCLSVGYDCSVTASEMTYTVSGGALNSTQSNEEFSSKQNIKEITYTVRVNRTQDIFVHMITKY